MIVIGNKWYFENLGTVNFPCPHCGKTPTVVCWGRNKASVYWIPTFTIKESYAVECHQCKEHWLIDKVTGDQLRQQAQGGGSGQFAPPPAMPLPAMAPPTPATDQMPPGVSAGGSPGATCRQCGELLAPKARFCQGCGAPVPAPATCAACGHLLSTGKFCSNCGAPVAAAGEQVRG